jgi:hypothetical protein
MCANISFVTVAGRTSLAVNVARNEKRAAAVKNPFRLRALRLDRNAKQSRKRSTSVVTQRSLEIEPCDSKRV